MNDSTTSEQKVLGVITARGGSKGLPKKNIRPLAGKPLVNWTIEAANNSRLLSRVILSSDDDEIISTAKAHGCDVPFVRPPELAEDDSSIVDVLLHALDALHESYDYIVLLQATSPLRTGEDIDACIELCMSPDVPAVVSMTEPGKSPYWMYQLDDSGVIKPLFPENSQANRRQMLPTAYAPNGAVYVVDTDFFIERKSFYTELTRAYLMPGDRSADIDTELDFLLAEAVIEHKLNTQSN